MENTDKNKEEQMRTKEIMEENVKKAALKNKAQESKELRRSGAVVETRRAKPIKDPLKVKATQELWDKGTFDKKERKHHQRTESENLKMSVVNKERKAIQRLRPITDEILQEILITPDPVSGKVYMRQYLENFFKEAKDNPSSYSGRLLASYVMGQDLMGRLDSAIEREQEKDKEFGLYKLRQRLFRQQQEVFDDDKNKMIIAVCSRRAGKSYLAAHIAMKAAYVPNLHVLYLNRTFDNAYNQMGSIIQQTLNDFKIQVTGSLAGGMIKFSNGSYIKIAGCNNKGQIDSFRGDSNDIIICDEIGHMRSSRELVNEVLGPSLIQSKYAQMLFIGTPSRTKLSYAKELWDNPKIQHYFWTWQDNPFIPDTVTLESLAEQYGTTIDDPFIRREYCGEWITDINAELFHDYQTYSKLPEGAITHCYVGVDWGGIDAAAITTTVVINRTLYVYKTWSKSHVGTQEMCDKIKEMWDELKTLKPARDPWVITDSNDKQAQFDLSYVYKLPNVISAYKVDKMNAFAQMADNLRRGIIRVNERDEAMRRDLDNCLLKRDENTDEILYEIDEQIFHMNPGYALLYITRQFNQDMLAYRGEPYNDGRPSTAREFIEQTFDNNGEGYLVEQLPVNDDRNDAVTHKYVEPVDPNIIGPKYHSKKAAVK